MSLAAWASDCRLGCCSDRSSRRARERTRRGPLDDEEQAEEGEQQLRRPPCLRDSVRGSTRSQAVVGSRLCRRLLVGLSVLAFWFECEECATTTTTA